MQKLLKYWPLLTLAILSVFGSWLCLLFITPLYQTDAKIQLKSEHKYPADSTVSGTPYQSFTVSSADEINIIQSKELLAEVVRSLDLYPAVFVKGLFRNYQEYNNPPVIINTDAASAFVPIQNVPFTITRSTIIIDKKGYPLDEWVVTPYGKLKFNTNQHFKAVNKKNTYCFSLTSANNVIDAISSKLDVHTGESLSSVIYISLKDAVPQRGEDILNRLIMCYNHSKVTERTANNQNKFNYIDKRLAAINSKMLELEKKEQDYRSQKESALVHEDNRYLREFQLNLIENRLAKTSHQYNTESLVYAYLLQKKEESTLSDLDNTPQCKIIDPPESSDLPVSPQKRIIYLTSFLLALTAAIGFISLKRLTVSKIVPQKFGLRNTSLPAADNLKIEKGADTLLIDASHITVMSEQFKKLRTTLNYLGIKGERKTILVTSSILGEGKSFIATNLALSLALTGKRVALLDFNLHYPVLARKLNIEPGLGISDYLKQEAEFSQIIKPTELNEHLFFISAGNIVDQPSELIKRDHLAEMLKRLSAEFNYIVMDTPPVGFISDAYVLSAHCDASIYTVRHAFTPESFADRFDENNNLNRLKNVTMVFNGAVQQANSSRYESGYNYNYGD